MLHRALALGLFLCFMRVGLPQDTPRYLRDNCVKAKDGKLSQLATYLQDVTVKLAKVRMDAGAYDFLVITQAIIPSGTSAICDFHVVYGSTGFPPETPGAEQNAADMKKSGLAMTREQMMAKRDEISTLVSLDFWRRHEIVGTSVKGGYARLNFYKTKPGATQAEWARMEGSGWKALAAVWAAETPGMGWGANTLALPGGSSQPYNAMTIDSFPNWAALAKGLPARATWNKVHPDTDMTLYMDRLGTVADRTRVEVVKLIEVIRK